MARRKYATAEIDAKAIAIVKGEKLRWENATAFVTDRVSFKMRQLIRVLRKNYYGIFDEPIDPSTGREKIWSPITEIHVEAVVKNVDLDQKDINFRSKTPNGYELTDVTRAAVKDKLSKIGFGQKLDDLERSVAIDGTGVWKTYEQQGKMIVEKVDLLNIFLDPTTPSIADAYRFTERTLMFPEQIAGMNWRNTENIYEDVPEGLPRVDPWYLAKGNQTNSNVKERDVYEMWGKFPKSLMTGLVADDNEEVEGRIVVSGIDSPGMERCHVIERNNKKDAEGNYLKPYEEVWYTRVPNRWYGRGIAEKILALQVYANINLNVRINRSMISQLGLFKMRKGSGVTPQALSRLVSNGVVQLNSMDDMEQFQIQEMGMTSYKDEEVINTIAEKLTGAFDVSTGEGMPASTSATANAIQNQNAKTGFSLIKDQFGQFLKRWMDRQALPIIAKELTANEIVRITADEDTFNELVERVVLAKALVALDEHFEKGYIPSPQELETAMNTAREKMGRSGMFVKLLKDVIAEELETEVYITNEEMDVAVTIQNLISLLNFTPQYADAIVKQVTDLMGISPMKATTPAQPQTSQQLPLPAGTGGAPNGIPAPQPGMAQQQQQQLTGALTR